MYYFSEHYPRNLQATDTLTWQGTVSLPRCPWILAEHARARTMIPGFISMIGFEIDINKADD